MAALNSHSVSDQGNQRQNNEDCYLSCPEAGLWAVADGMGGHEAGEVASAIVTATLKSATSTRLSLRTSIQNAHTCVLDAATSGEGAIGMGSTVVAMYSRGHHYEIAWVGDSRAYLWSQKDNGGHLEQLTRDHSYVQMLLKSGAISESEVYDHPDKNVITQCIGSEDLQQVDVDVIEGEWQKQQMIILCSDGLTDELDDQAIARILCQTSSPKEAAQKLLQAALKRGGRDNITIQVIESPLYERSQLERLAEWLPDLTGKVWLDGILYTAALLSIFIIFHWLLS